MNPKEKAEELVEKYAELASRFGQATEWEYDKQCAIICVDEIIENNIIVLSGGVYLRELNYWQEVKEEIEEL